MAFPEALAAVLMATHLHLITAWSSSRAAQRRLVKVLSGCARRRSAVEGRIAWEQVPLPDEIPNAHHLARQVRYVVLNPSRARLVDDPLRWLWSTHRDVMGAVAQPWVTADRLAAAMKRSADGYSADLHRYVSSDPSVNVAGTPPPVAAERRTSPVESLERIAEATAATLRVEPNAVKVRGEARLLLVQLAHARGWRDTRALADACDTSVRTVQRLIVSPPGPSLAAGLLCLGDDRLLFYMPRDEARRGHAAAARR
jgi:hypothetical protein